MAKQSPASKNSITPPASFQVTQVIGTVSLSEHGEMPPTMAAFKLIADSYMPGTFEFPNVYGGKTIVTVGSPENLDDAATDPYEVSDEY